MWKAYRMELSTPGSLILIESTPSRCQAIVIARVSIVIVKSHSPVTL